MVKVNGSYFLYIDLLGSNFLQTFFRFFNEKKSINEFYRSLYNTGYSNCNISINGAL